MSIRLTLLLLLGAGMLALALLGMWPRRKLRAGRQNNWRQRDGTEILSSATDANGGTVSPIDVALGTGETGVF
jgi:hypothetical protein